MQLYYVAKQIVRRRLRRPQASCEARDGGRSDYDMSEGQTHES